MSRRRFIENLEGIVDLIDSGDVIKAMTTLWQIWVYHNPWVGDFSILIVIYEGFRNSYKHAMSDTVKKGFDFFSPNVLW